MRIIYNPINSLMDLQQLLEKKSKWKTAFNDWCNTPKVKGFEWVETHSFCAAMIFFEVEPDYTNSLEYIFLIEKGITHIKAPTRIFIDSIDIAQIAIPR